MHASSQANGWHVFEVWRAGLISAAWSRAHMTKPGETSLRHLSVLKLSYRVDIHRLHKHASSLSNCLLSGCLPSCQPMYYIVLCLAGQERWSQRDCEGCSSDHTASLVCRGALQPKHTITELLLLHETRWWPPRATLEKFANFKTMCLDFFWWAPPGAEIPQFTTLVSSPAPHCSVSAWLFCGLFMALCGLLHMTK